METKKMKFNKKDIYAPQVHLKELIYTFTNQYRVFLHEKDGEGSELVNTIPTRMEVALDLHIDPINNLVWIDMNDAYKQEKGFVMFLNVNCMGNNPENLPVLMELQLWMNDIFAFGLEMLHSVKEQNTNIKNLFTNEALISYTKRQRPADDESLDDNK